MAKVDILNLEWTSGGRDIHIIEPVLCYLESKGYSVVRDSFLFALWKIIRFRPRMLVLSNNTGSIRNFLVTKFAYKLGVKTVTLCSEGDYCTLGDKNSINSFFWGWDLEREFPVDLHLEWSQKNMILIKDYAQGIDSIWDRIKVSGATGFDRYKLLSFKSKSEFIKQYNLGVYKRIIGYAAWGFDLYYDEKFCQASTFNLTDEYMTFHKNNRELLKEILKKLIVSNPDKLFVLKRHPGELVYEETELSGLEKYSNVLLITNEEKIEDLINICDIWMAYESTTCMEAWLMNKQTVLINPIRFDDNRSDISKGSPVRSDIESLQNDVDTGIVDGFDVLESVRKDIIAKVMEFSDGKNYLRAGNFIIDEMNNKRSERRCNFDFWCFKQLIKESIKVFFYYSFFKSIPGISCLVDDCVNFDKIYSNDERSLYTETYASAIRKG